MKIHYYRIEIQGLSLTIGDLLDDIRVKPQAQRERSVHGKHVFLEHCSVINGLYEMEFTQRRIRNGPGYSKRGRPTTDFSLEQDAGFGEHAAAIWSPKGYLAAQYNHYGVRPSGIRAYLEGLLHARYGSMVNRLKVVFEPVLDREAFARLRRSWKQTRLECAINANTVTDDMARCNVALATALQLHNQTSAGRVEISVSLGEGKRGGPLQDVLETVQSLLPFAENLARFKVTIKEDLDTATEVLDLLGHRETALVPDSQLQMTPGRRFTYQSRIDAIRTRFEPWLLQQPANTATGNA